MNERKITTTKLVLKKISALRATCSDEEREILDRFFSGRVSFDVEGHMIYEQAKSGITPRITTDQDTGANMMTNLANVPTKAPSPQDAEGHIATAGSITYRLWYDKEKQAYRLET